MLVQYILAILLGFGLVTAGAYSLVWGSDKLAVHFGIGQMIIGATVVALGTSLPELIAVIVASAQGKHDIGLGNIVGSNIINVIGILGLAVLILPVTVTRSQISPVTIIAFVAASCYLLSCLLFRGRIGRIDGLVLVTVFIIYNWASVALGKTQ